MASKPKSKKIKAIVPVPEPELNENEFIVENIVEKKLEADVWKYLVKWLGYPSDCNTWEPVEHFISSAAKTMLSQFEEQWEKKNAAAELPLKTEPESPPMPESELLPMAEPELLPIAEQELPPIAEPEILVDEPISDSSDYVSDEDEKVSSEKTKNFLDFDILEECPPNKEPESMLGVVDLSGHLTYLVEWKKDKENVTEDDQEDKNLIHSTPFRLKYPQVVIDFYRQHISFNSSPPSDDVIAERAVQALTAAREREAADRAELESEITPAPEAKAVFANLDTSSDSSDSYEVDHSI